MKMWGYVQELEASQESTHFSFLGVCVCVCVCVCVYFFSLMEDPEKAMAPPLQYSCLENPMDGGAW